MNNTSQFDGAKAVQEFGRAEATRLPQFIGKLLSEQPNFLLRRLNKRSSDEGPWSFRKRFQIPRVCPLDFRDKYAMTEWLTAQHKIAAANIGFWVERQLVKAFTLAAKHKVIAAAGMDVVDADHFPAIVPAASLTPALLHQWRARLCQEGGKHVLALPTNRDGGPMLDLLCDQLVSESLLPFDPLGIGPVRSGRRSAGYQHLLGSYVPRHDFVAGEWRETPMFAGAADVQEITREYLASPFQDTLLLFAGCAEIKLSYPNLPSPHRDPDLLGLESAFMVPWQWFSMPGMQGCGLDGTDGFWWCDVMLEFKALLPERMVVIRHRRCDVPEAVYFQPLVYPN